MKVNYDINSRDISEARELILKSDGTRFRIFLEIVTSCLGNCTGCSLSYIHKSDFSPELSIEKIQEILTYFIPIINKKNNLTSVVNLGTGDYFMMDENFLDGLFKSIRVFFDQLKTPRNILTVSTSLFLSEEKMKSRLDIMSKYLHPTQFAIDGVIDPLMLEKHYDRYLRNCIALKKVFPFFDLVLNLSDAIQVEHLELMKKFLKELNLLSFDIQYALHKGNVYRVKTSPEKIEKIFLDVQESVGKDFNELVQKNIAVPNTDGEGTVFDEIKGQAKEIAKERVMVNAKGDIYPIAFGYNDILLNENYDFPPIGSIYEPYDEEKAAQIIEKYLTKIFYDNKKCRVCEFSHLCYSTGYSFYNKFSDPNKCENVGLFMFKKVQNEKQRI